MSSKPWSYIVASKQPLRSNPISWPWAIYRLVPIGDDGRYLQMVPIDYFFDKAKADVRCDYLNQLNQQKEG